jgi:hypothetical protein
VRRRSAHCGRHRPVRRKTRKAARRASWDPAVAAPVTSIPAGTLCTSKLHFVGRLRTTVAGSAIAELPIGSNEMGTLNGQPNHQKCLCHWSAPRPWLQDVPE